MLTTPGLSAEQVQALIDATPGVRKQITQAAHGFMAGDVLRMDGTAYTKALADSAANAEVVGMVASVPDANTFVLAIGGLVPVSALNFEEESVTPGALYFLSVENAGLMQLAEPSTDGQISKPVFIAVSATSGYFFNMRGAEVGAGAAENPVVGWATIVVEHGDIGSETHGGSVTSVNGSGGTFAIEILGDYLPSITGGNSSGSANVNSTYEGSVANARWIDAATGLFSTDSGTIFALFFKKP